MTAFAVAIGRRGSLASGDVVLRKLLAAICLLLASAGVAAAGDRVALVIGNGAYQNAIALPNPPRDAKSVAGMLRGMHFKVIEGEDLTKAALDEKLREFAQAAETADVAFVFYAGHGMQVNGKNYLIPVDAKLADATAIDFETVSADRVIKYAERKNGIAIVLLDACRDNPLSRRFARSFAATRSLNVGQGLAAPHVSGGGIVIGFATAPGDTASDGAGDHSPFTAALLKYLPAPGLEIQQALTRVKAAVYASTNGQQEPWHDSNLRFEFYLNPAPAGAEKGDAASLPADEVLWRKLATNGDAAALRLFIDAYPASAHASEAKARLAALTKNEKIRPAFSGELKPPPSPAYFAYRDETVTRDGPGNKYASRFGLKAGEQVRAVGLYVAKSDPDGPFQSDEERTWVEVATADGNEGFALAHDLLSPDQFAKRKRLLAQGEKLKAYLDRAKKGWGALSRFNGVWTPGGKCIDPVPGGLHINLGLALLSRWIMWSEGDTYYRLDALAADKPVVYSVRRAASISLRGSGRVQMYQMDAGSIHDRLGFKGDQGFYHKTGNNYGILRKCGTIDAESYHIMDLWAEWVEDQQRQPDKK
jgi:Caspase domain